MNNLRNDSRKPIREAITTNAHGGQRPLKEHGDGEITVNREFYLRENVV